ncbi:2Fe-2S iron-sulfur cluster-binding protein [Paraburkholderia sp. CNPSo 3076]|nr:2Fe-2S iron-sulfur cluster-binding protein [Paraburkholderia sp. CNPSo 3076]
MPEIKWHTGEAIVCGRGERVLVAMERSGATFIPVGCRGGGCGVCKVRVLVGRYHTGRMSVRHISPEEGGAGIVLACQLYPVEDLELSDDLG